MIWLVRLVALGALFAGRSIFVPGVDGSALAVMRLGTGLSAGHESASLFGVAIRNQGITPNYGAALAISQAIVAC